MRRLIMTTIAALAAFPAVADDAALLIGNDRYENFDRLRGAVSVVNTARAFSQAGYAVEAFANKSLAELYDGLVRFESESRAADRIVVALSGRFVTDGQRTWLVTPDAEINTIFDADQSGVSVEAAMRVLSYAPGQAVLVLGYDADALDRIAPFMREGIGALDIPQGVTVMTGEPRDVASEIANVILKEGENIVASARTNDDISLRGFRPRALVMQQAAGGNDDVEPRPYIVDTARENAFWANVRARDTAAAYESYLQAYPNGRFAEVARATILEIRSEPDRAARLREEALNLSLDQRRSVQRNLTLLEYDTRGIDGIFGPGTRAAIADWQGDNGFNPSSYLTQDFIDRIAAEARRRAAELEQLAAEALAQQQREDRAFWDDTGRGGTEQGLRAYLDRYPDGLFAAQAQDRLDQILADKQDQASRQETNAWNNARERNTIPAYRRYLRNYPDGTFAEEAENRIARLGREASDAPARDRAIAIENALNLNNLTRGLVLGRLRQLGFDAGRNVGQFDNQTRRAIRQFQKSRNLDVTGYLNQQAIVLLLTNGNN